MQPQMEMADVQFDNSGVTGIKQWRILDLLFAWFLTGRRGRK